ncbi:hypothetical protein SAMN05443244_0907 [Terriglobus roseus]|uniref:Uncharacterized protein n=1 Tax=Terriglobus roseus TaxID=392734 RepID=A0A1H4JZ05_9BACT|nr:hypothetical protein SAMN05443244_0907 [Terriglobus roseus]
MGIVFARATWHGDIAVSEVDPRSILFELKGSPAPTVRGLDVVGDLDERIGDLAPYNTMPVREPRYTTSIYCRSTLSDPRKRTIIRERYLTKLRRHKVVAVTGGPFE